MPIPRVPADERNNSTELLNSVANILNFSAHTSVEMDGQDIASQVGMSSPPNLPGEVRPKALKTQSTRELLHKVSDYDISQPKYCYGTTLSSHQTVSETFRGNWHIVVILVVLCIVTLSALSAVGAFFHMGHYKSAFGMIVIALVAGAPTVYYSIYIDRARHGERGYKLENIPTWHQ